MKTRINEITSEIIETINIWYCNGKLNIHLKEQFDYTTIKQLKEVVSYLIEDYRPELEEMWLKHFKRHKIEQSTVDAIILMELTLMVNTNAHQAYKKLRNERWVEPVKY